LRSEIDTVGEVPCEATELRELRDVHGANGFALHSSLMGPESGFHRGVRTYGD
jgi:hypothetical protein